MNIILKIFLIYFLLVFNLAKADGHNSKENWSFYTGTFDFSDEGKKATLPSVYQSSASSFLPIYSVFRPLLLSVTNVDSKYILDIFIQDFRFTMRDH